MNRLKKELKNRGITYACEDISGYDPYEAEEQLIAVTNGFIITGYYCNVLEPMYKIYDRNFNCIAIQSSERTDSFCGNKCMNPWGVGMMEA